MGKPKKKAPGKLETIKTVIEILTDIAVIVGVIYELLRG